MATVFLVDDTDDDPVPNAESTIVLSDDGIEIPELEVRDDVLRDRERGQHPARGVHQRVSPATTRPPPPPATSARSSANGSRVDRSGPVPHDLHFPGGHQTIPPGGTVVLTMTLRAGHTY